MESEIYEINGRIVYDTISEDGELAIVTKCAFEHEAVFTRKVQNDMDVRIAAAALDLEIAWFELLNIAYGVTSTKMDSATIRIVDGGIFVGLDSVTDDLNAIMLMLAHRRGVYLSVIDRQRFHFTEARKQRPIERSKPVQARKPATRQPVPSKTKVVYDEV